MEVRGCNFASRPAQQMRVIREIGTYVAPLLVVLQAGCTDVRRSLRLCTRHTHSAEACQSPASQGSSTAWTT